MRETVDLIARDAPRLDPAIVPREALYGCNVALRLSLMRGLRFDEALPPYGWQEDLDLTMQLARRGRLISSGLVTGVHLGVRGGRTSGRRLGYSQVANLVYLLRKGTIPRWLAKRLFWRNLAANLLRAPFPEPHIDRAGRLGTCPADLCTHPAHGPRPWRNGPAARPRYPTARAGG